jgi:hypothetical protein
MDMGRWEMDRWEMDPLEKLANEELRTRDTDRWRNRDLGDMKCEENHRFISRGHRYIA